MTSLHKLLLGCIFALPVCSTASAQPAKAGGKGLDPAVITAYEELQGVHGGLVVTRPRNFNEARNSPETIADFFARNASSATSTSAPAVFEDGGTRYSILPLTSPWSRRDRVQFVPGTEAAQMGLPGFSFDADMLARPPAVDVPFCLVFQAGLRNVGLQQLTDLDHLVNLSLLDTEVTDEGLANLAGLKNLTTLHVRDRRRPLGNPGPGFGAGPGAGGGDPVPNPGIPIPPVKRKGAGLGDGGPAGVPPGAGGPPGGGQPGGGRPAGGKGKKGIAPGGGGRGGFAGIGGNITDAGLKEIGKLTKLTSLTLECPAITDAGIKELAGLKNLTYLSLSTRNIGDDGLKTIAGFKNLTHLKLSSSGFARPEGLTELAPLNKLTTLELGIDGFLGSNDETVRTLRKIGLLHALPFAEGKDGARPKSSDEVLSIDFSDGNSNLTESSLREFVDLKNLHVLNLTNFRVTDAGLRDLVWLKNLKSLDLRNTQATGTGIAALVPSLPNLTELKIDHRMVNDDCLRGLRESGLLHTIPFVHGKDGKRPKSAEEVDSLLLNNTDVTNAALKELVPLRNLSRLDLHSTRISDIGLKELALLKNLQSLNVTVSGVQGSGLKYLVSLEKLASVQLNPEIVTNATLKDLLHIKGLTSLDLRQSRVTNEGLKSLKGATHLSRIRLSPSHLTSGSVRLLREIGMLHLLDFAWAEDFEFPKTAQDVFLLRLSGTAIDDDALKELAGFSNLAVLYLEKTHITDAGLKHLAGLKNLSSLHLDGTQVTDAGLAELLPLKELSTLYLKNTHVTSAGMKHLAALENLGELSLANTKVTDSGLKQLASLKHLAQVFVEDTAVTDVSVAYLRRALPTCQVSRIALPRTLQPGFPAASGSPGGSGAGGGGFGKSSKGTGRGAP